MKKRLLCLLLTFALLAALSACAGQPTSEPSASSAASGSESVDMQPPDGSSETAASSEPGADTSETSSSSEAVVPPAEDGLFLDPPASLTRLEDITETFRQTLNGAFLDSFTVGAGENGGFAARFVPQGADKYTDLWFDADGAVTDTVRYPKLTKPTHDLAGARRIFPDYERNALMQFGEDGQAHPLALPDADQIVGRIDSCAAVTRDERLVLYIAGNTLRLYDVEAAALRWEMTPEALGFEPDVFLTAVSIENDERARVLASPDEQNMSFSETYIELDTQRVFSPDFTAFAEMQGNGHVSAYTVDGTHYLWLPANAANGGAREPVRLVRLSGDRYEIVRSLELVAQEYLLSEDGKQILFTDRNDETDEVTFTLCNVSDFAPAAQTVLRLRVPGSGGMITPRVLTGGVLLFTGTEGLADRDMQFYRLSLDV